MGFGGGTATPSFTAGLVGVVYVLQLEVSDGIATDTATVNVAVVSNLDTIAIDLIWTGTEWV